MNTTTNRTEDRINFLYSLLGITVEKRYKFNS